jgi:tetratricopeptide (TPR) repeat protein
MGRIHGDEVASVLMRPTLFYIFTRPMTWIGRLARPALVVVPAALIAGALLTTATGCDQLDARGNIGKGNKLFKEAKFKEAAERYEEALKKLDHPTAHYNLGLTYSKLFSPGKDTPENKAIADKSAEQFQIWLKSNPSDNATRDLMTQTWIDAGEFEKALAYWEGEHKADDKNREIMGRLAGINLKAGRWRKSMEWYVKVAEAATDNTAKVTAYQSIGNVAWSKLNNKDKLIWGERIECADLGIGALSMAATLSPKRPELQGLMASIYNFRALAQGASFAAAIDRANSQDHDRIRRVLVEEAKKAAGGGGGSASPPSTNPPGPTPAPSPDKPAEASPKSGG